VVISVPALLVRAVLEVRCRRAGLRGSADRVLHAFACPVWMARATANWVT